MLVPLQITFQDTDSSSAIEEKIRHSTEKLEKFFDGITNVRVVVSTTQYGQRAGNQYRVRLDVSVPGKELVVNREPGDANSHRDPLIATRDAFEAMERILRDYVRERRGETKHDVASPHGHIARVFPQEGYGFIESPDGRDIYFHEKSVLKNGFKRLKAGMEVRFLEEKGEKGPQASTVEIVGTGVRHDEGAHPFK